MYQRWLLIFLWMLSYSVQNIKKNSGIALHVSAYLKYSSTEKVIIHLFAGSFSNCWYREDMARPKLETSSSYNYPMLIVGTQVFRPSFPATSPLSGIQIGSRVKQGPPYSSRINPPRWPSFLSQLQVYL